MLGFLVSEWMSDTNSSRKVIRRLYVTLLFPKLRAECQSEVQYPWLCILSFALHSTSNANALPVLTPLQLLYTLRQKWGSLPHFCNSCCNSGCNSRGSLMLPTMLRNNTKHDHHIARETWVHQKSLKRKGKTQQWEHPDNTSKDKIQSTTPLIHGMFLNHNGHNEKSQHWGTTGLALSMYITNQSLQSLWN